MLEILAVEGFAFGLDRRGENQRVVEGNRMVARQRYRGSVRLERQVAQPWESASG